MKAKIDCVRYVIHPAGVCNPYAHGESVVLSRRGRVIFDTEDYPCKGDSLEAPAMPLPQRGDVIDVYTDCNHIRIHVKRAFLDDGDIVVEGPAEYEGAWGGFGQAWCAAVPLDEAPFRAATIESSYGRLTWAQRDALGRLMVLAAFAHGGYWYDDLHHLPHGKSVLGRILWEAVQSGDPRQVAAALGFIVAERMRPGGPREEREVERAWRAADKERLARWADQKMNADARAIARGGETFADAIIVLISAFSA